MPNQTDPQRPKISEIIEAGFNMQKFQDASVSNYLLLEKLWEDMVP